MIFSTELKPLIIPDFMLNGLQFKDCAMKDEYTLHWFIEVILDFIAVCLRGLLRRWMIYDCFEWDLRLAENGFRRGFENTSGLVG